MIKREDRIDIKNEPIIEGVESSINSSDAIDMVSHSSEVIINLMTPIGIRYRGKTKFIGRHSDNFMLLEIPELPEEDLNFFFQEGFMIDIQAISAKGEGALIQFRSQIVHILLAPIPMLLISIPGMMKIKQLRQEPRFDVNLKAQMFTQALKLECEIRDLSKGGCRFITSPLAKQMDVGQQISIRIFTPRKSVIEVLPLSGMVCNLQCSRHYAKYGLKFDDPSRTHAKNLFKNMKFDVTKLELKF
jgi:c-di-GMP-binding flagellar brake protein YcgR